MLNKKLKIIGIIILGLSFVSCATTSKNYKTLKGAKGFEKSNSTLNFSYSIDENRAKEIRDYFSENTELNLNEIYASSDSTLEKTLQIATFVSKNIPHANQKAIVEKGNSIYLWEYHLNIENAFNCKFHSFFTYELLLSVGILNHFVWCMPKSKNDNDCHVVNNVWIPELSKWVMIDTDQRAYVCDESNTLLSIQEIREKLITKDPLKVSPIEKMYQTPKDYLDYLSKDFYWFITYEKVRFISDLGYPDENHVINLLPLGFYGFRTGEKDIFTNDEEAFWVKPE